MPDPNGRYGQYEQVNGGVVNDLLDRVAALEARERDLRLHYIGACRLLAEASRHLDEHCYSDTEIEAALQDCCTLCGHLRTGRSRPAGFFLDVDPTVPVPFT